jgi:autotransporter-associated beta strand protein
VISGTGAFNQNGTGTTILTATETYTGLTKVNAGTLEVDGSLSSLTVAVATGGTLTGTGTIHGKATMTGNGVIDLGSGANINGTLGVTGGNWIGGGTVGGLVTSSSGNFNLNGSLTAPAGLSVTGGTLAGGGTLTGKLTYSSTASSTFGGVIAGTGATLSKAGVSTLTLTGHNTYTGLTTVTTGTLQVGNGLIAGASLGSGNVTVARAGTLAIDLVDGDTFANNVTDTGHITDIAPSGTHAIASLISGTGTFTKSGAGTAALIAANTYTGATAINGGTLLANNVTGFATGTGTVSINNGGTLGGSGITKAVTLNTGGIIAPGAGLPGTAGTTLHASSLLWNAGGTLKLQLGPTGDELVLSGALTKGTLGTYTLDLIDAGIVPGNYTLATFASTTFLSSNFTLELPAGYDGSLVETSTSLSINLSVHAQSVSGGTLTVNGSTDTSGGVTTLSGGTLSLSGGANTFAGTTAISGGTLTLSGSATTSAYAGILTKSTPILSGANTTVAIVSGLSGNTLTLGSAAGALAPTGSITTSADSAGSPVEVVPATPISGDNPLLVASDSVLESDRSVSFTLAPTPEPGTALLLTLGTGMILGWRRRRRA